MARSHPKGPVGGTGKNARQGLHRLAEQDDLIHKDRIARNEAQKHEARKRRIQLVEAVGRLSFQHGVAVFNADTLELREGVTLLVEQQGWELRWQGDDVAYVLKRQVA